MAVSKLFCWWTNQASCYLVLLLIVCIGRHVEATSCVPGIKNFFASRTSYEKLADYLFKLTPSSELKDNTRLAMELSGEQVRAKKQNDQLGGLAMSFATLNDTTKEQLCRASTMRNVRLLADAMAQDGGNTGPKRITNSVRRLNRVLIGVVTRARALCLDHFESKLPVAWEPQFSFPDMSKYLEQLDKMPNLILFKGYLGISTSTPQDLAMWETVLAHRLADIIATDQLFYSKSHTAHLAWSHDSLIGFIERFIRKPCGEFMMLHMAKSTLEPYRDLLLASFIISPYVGSMDKFYENPGERPQIFQWDYDKQVMKNARRFQACSLLSDMDTWHLAELVLRVESGPLKSRRTASRS